MINKFLNLVLQQSPKEKLVGVKSGHELLKYRLSRLCSKVLYSGHGHTFPEHYHCID